MSNMPSAPVTPERQFNLDDLARSGGPTTPWAFVPRGTMTLDRAETVELEKNLKGAKGGVYRDAQAAGYASLSAYLEAQDPTPPGEVGDAFMRQLARAQVRTRSVRNVNEAIGASTLHALRKARPELLPEFVARTWMQHCEGVGAMAPESRFFASSQPPSELLRPGMWERMIRESAPLRRSRLARLIATTTTQDDPVTKRFYLEIDEADRKLRRLTEGASMPRVRLQTGTTATTSMYKYGRILEWSDEAERFVTLDEIAFIIGLIVQQSELDQEGEVVYTLINGDGSPNSSASVVTISSLGGVAGTIDAASLFSFLASFGEEGLHVPNLTIGLRAGVVKLAMCNLGSANWPLFLGSGSQSLLTGQGSAADILRQPDILVVSGVTSGYLLYYDVANGVVRKVLAGFPLEETDRIIDGGINQMALTEWVGFERRVPGGVKALDYLN